LVRDTENDDDMEQDDSQVSMGGKSLVSQQ
jgi:hypothetical protein